MATAELLIAPDVAIETAADTRWDVAIVGAGPAGSLTAQQLATRGLKVLLVEKEQFPRDKVCGGCLNLRARACLQRAGLDHLVTEAGATPLERFRLRCRQSQATITMNGGVAVTRRVLDASLVRAAQAAGAVFLPGIRAAGGPVDRSGRTLTLQSASTRVAIQAKVIVASDGLQSSLMSSLGVPPEVAAGAYVGVGAIGASAARLEAGTVYMACGSGGYAGMVEAEEGRTIFGAALQPAHLRQHRNPAAAVAAIFEEAGLATLAPKLAALRWKGTPPLTRQSPRVALDRVFAVGDACGYVEPFTGEGMAWAFAAALAVVPIAEAACGDYNEKMAAEWTRVYRQMVVRRQFTCRAMARMTRFPMLLARFLQSRSGRFLAARILHHINRPI